MRNKLLLVGLIAAGFCVGAEPGEKEFGSIDSGKTIPHIAVGDGVWATEFRVYSLENFLQAFVLRFFDSDGRPLLLNVDSPTGFIGQVDAIAGSLNAGGIARFSAGPAGPLKVGYAILETSEFSGIAIDAVITNGASFRTSIPGMRRFQDHLRFPFVNSGGSVSCIAWKSDAGQRVTIVARDSQGHELCRDSRQLNDNQHEAFCLADRLPCVANRDGLLEVTTDFVGLTAISLTADPLGRLWTTVPQSLCCFNP